MINKFQAVHALVGGEITGGEDLSEYIFHNGQTPPTEEAVQAKLTELRNAEPMKVLREERNQLLSATDWWCVSDRTATPEQLQYRQALRDLPANSTPALDENGQLTGVEWPNKPE